MLESLNPDDVPLLPFKGECVDCRVTDVYDGDTCTVVVLYQNVPLKMRIRINGIDTPEIKCKAGELKELEGRAGKFVRDRVIELIHDKILKLDIKCFDKYGGRVVGTVYLSDDMTLADYLLEKRYAKKYTGKTKKEVWTREELEAILNG